jgi:hypothetical protein
MSDRRRIPMVRPPRQAAGGGVGAPSFANNSGAPGQPSREDGKRARDETRLRYALARVRFFERLFVFPQFAALSAATPQDSQSIDIKSNGDSFVRLVAMRGCMTSNAPLTGQELAQLFLTLSIDGLEDFTTSGQRQNPASFEIMFSESAAPWMWLAAPPLLRVGETISATIRTTVSGEVALTPQFAVRLVDDNVWCELYGS